MRKVLKNITKDHAKETALSFSRTWVENISRGELCLVNDTTYLLFKRLEAVVKSGLPVTTAKLRDHDIREGICEAAILDKDILVVTQRYLNMHH